VAAAKKYLQFKWAHLFTLPACLVSEHALFVPANITLVLLKRIFANKYV
jgi:hypothetical protein